ncbi:MAG: hypothetical protein WKG01_38710 [Kofleriaceae bacterium]
MLDPWIIEEILKKEENARREHERRPAELPLDRYRDTGERPVVKPPNDEGQRGVVVIDI